MPSQRQVVQGSVRVKILETERLILRKMTVEDAEFIFELVNEPAFIRNIGDKGVRTLDDAREYILSGPVAVIRSSDLDCMRWSSRKRGRQSESVGC